MNKNIFFAIIFVLFASSGFAQEFQLSTHILDVTQGKPAPDVRIRLSKKEISGIWTIVDNKQTDKNGRVPDFLKQRINVNHHGVYKLTFFVAPYFESLEQETFYPLIEVIFEIKDDKHYHVPITLSPYGYSTYRGN